MRELRLEAIERGDSPWLGDIARLYRTSFPISERKPIDFLGEAIERSDYLLLAGVRAESLAAMAVVYMSPGGGFVVLEYMAVHPSQRGTGVGSALLAALAERAAVPLLLEVERVRDAEPGAELRRRRILFYRRRSCREVAGFVYRMPRISTETPPAMMLMVRGWPSTVIPGDLLRAWLAEIYERVYRQPPDHPLLARMEQALAERMPLI